MTARTTFLRACLPALALMLAACGGGGGGTASMSTPTPTASVAGSVVSATSNAALAGVTVSNGSASTTTAADGSFTLAGLAAGSSQTLTFSRAGYSMGMRTVTLTGTINRADGRLQPFSVSRSVVAGAPAVVSDAASPAQVQLPGAYVTSSGTAYSGMVSVSLSVVDPSANPGNMAGGYQAVIPGSSSTALIESYGAVEVTLRDSSGNRLNLAPGQAATLRIPLAAARAGAAAPATIPLFYLNETTGLWVQEGNATLAGNLGSQYYEGTVTHFTLWNADQVAASITACGLVKDSTGKLVAGADVTAYGLDYLGSSHATSGSDGRYCVPVKRNARANLQATSVNPNLVSQVETVGPSLVDITVANPLVLSSQPTAPVILQQPVADPAQLHAGSSVLLSVLASGAPDLAYQWSRNGTAISGATQAVLVLSPLDAISSAGSYTVTVTNAIGSVTSNPLAITVDPALLPPVIVVPPASQSVSLNGSASFAVYAYAQGGTLSYQWQKNGSPIAGATMATYTTPALGTADNGNSYAVVVTSTLGTLTASATSSAAAVVVAAPVPVSIAAQPQAVTVQAGSAATFSVSASAGTNLLSYQWLRNGTAISGATSASYTTGATSLADSGSAYSVVVTSAQGASATSATAILTVTAAPVPVAVASQPQGATVQAGASVTFSVTASGGNGTYAYQWLRNGTPVSGATAASYTFITTSADNGATFAATVTSNGTSATSQTALLTVTPASTASTYYLLASAGPQAPFTSSFLAGAPAAVSTITASSQNLMAVNSSGSPATAVTVETAGQAGPPFAAFLDGSVSGTTLTNARVRLQLYVKGNTLRLIDQLVPAGGTLAGVQVSSLSTDQVCGQSGVPLLSSLAPQTQAIGTPFQNYLFLAFPGPDQVCGTADDTFAAVRMDMSPTTTPISLAAQPVMPIYSGSGALTGLIGLNGSTLQLFDASLRQTNASLYTVNTASFQSYGLLLGGSAPGIWLFSENGTLWGVNLATPATRTALYQLAPGEVFSYTAVTDGSTAYLAVTNPGAGTSRVIQVDTSLAPATQFTVLGLTSNLVMSLTPTRLVYYAANSPGVPAVFSLPRTSNPGATTIYLANSGQIQSVFVSGENVYISALVAQGGSAVQQLAIVNSDGSNPAALPDTYVLGTVLSSNQSLVLGAGSAYALLVGTNAASTPPGTNNNATLSTIEGATRNTLVTYGKVPAAPAGIMVPATYFGLGFGQGGLLSFFPNSGTQGNDLYYFNTGAAGLTLSTGFNTITPAAAHAAPIRTMRAPVVRKP